MPIEYIHRSMEEVITEAAQYFPVKTYSVSGEDSGTDNLVLGFI